MITVTHLRYIAGVRHRQAHRQHPRRALASILDEPITISTGPSPNPASTTELSTSAVAEGAPNMLAAGVLALSTLYLNA